jgi:hypothetical protein
VGRIMAKGYWIPQIDVDLVIVEGYGGPKF